MATKFSQKYLKEKEAKLKELADSLDKKEEERMAREERRRKEEEARRIFEQQMISLATTEGFTEEQAMVIYNKAYADGHGFGNHEIQSHMEDLIDFILEVAKAGQTA